ncbi:hypothetical protein NQ315_002269 [Exocentrus adspersus]|uniref:DJ-1/PfpI domain-containing protein n=1 Tax=Exocentrus adspersus TaxID=1586481 RepID=A0AAV8VSF9_9CUCU|nr:hypothetical protein NQ315_002269 [Exocentrus adspersus]
MSNQGYVDKRCSSCFAGARRKQIRESQPSTDLSLNSLFRKLSSAMGKKALLFLAPGAEEMEAVISVDVLRRAGLEVTVAGLCEASEPIKCSRGVLIKPDINVSEAKGPYDILLLPGGLGGSQSLSKSKEVGDLLKQQQNEGRWISAICAAPTALKAHGIGLGKKITSYPAMKDQLTDSYDYKEDNVVIDGNLITSRGPGTAFDFALAIVQALEGKEKAQEVAKGMLLNA